MELTAGSVPESSLFELSLLARAILQQVGEDFVEQRLSAHDLVNGYIGVSFEAIERTFCNQASIIPLDVGLAIKELEERKYIHAGASVRYRNNSPRAVVIFMNLGKREFVCLTDLGYRALVKLQEAQRKPERFRPQKGPLAEAGTAADENAAIRALTAHLKANSEVRRTDARDWCRSQGFRISDRGFQSRVWPEARKRAGLPVKAPPGRKRKSLH